MQNHEENAGWISEEFHPQPTEAEIKEWDKVFKNEMLAEQNERLAEQRRDFLFFFYAVILGLSFLICIIQDLPKLLQN